MVCIFMARLGAVLEHKEYTDFAVDQLLIHHKLLSGGPDGLYYHGYNGAQKNHMSSVCWGRANAWIIYATAQILKVAGDFDGKEELLERVRRHGAALKKYQRPDGGFGTVLDDESSYTEISATAGIAAGILEMVKLGVLDESYRTVFEKGVAAVAAAMEQDGAVSGVSTGTPVMPNAQAYKEIPCCPTLYGQGLAIVAFALEA